MSDTVYWVWLAERLGAGSEYLLTVLEHFSTPFEVFSAEPEEIENLKIDTRTKDALFNKNLTEAHAICDYCASHGIGILTYGSKYYPKRLMEIYNPPTVLYFKGRLPNTNDFLTLSIVGTRKMSEYGKRMAYKIAYELSAAGINVVSGMALGIDSVANCAAIMGGGRTIAVLGSGVDVVYPPQHAKLYNKIIENGAVISEYPPTTEPKGENFPKRNRIISGLSSGTLIVECSAKSGALITAELTEMQGKDLFAIPGNTDSRTAQGTNRLISDGAVIVIETEDILSYYEFYHKKKINYLAFSDAKKRSGDYADALENMGVCRREERDSSPSADNGQEKRDEQRKNTLLPRRLPKNNNSEDMPSTVKGQISNAVKTEPERRINTEEELADLDKNEREIFCAMPDDRAVNADFFVRFGFSCAEAISTLALLEIRGLVSSLPGGLYIKT